MLCEYYAQTVETSSVNIKSTIIHADCNDTGIPDACALAATDCNFDGRPDECGVRMDCLNPLDLFEDQKITASSESEGDLFGTSISIDANVAVVGAYLDDHVGCTDCGSTYVYRFDGSAWLQETRLIASDRTPDDEFGWSVSISGNKILVGASGDGCAAGLSCGAAYVFSFNGNQWIQEAKLVAADAASSVRFGESVSIHADVILVGARGADCTAGAECGAAYVFRRDDTISNWVQEAKLVASDAAANDQFGSSAAINGDTAVIGAPSADCLAGDDCGAAYVYRFDSANSEWVEEAKMIA